MFRIIICTILSTVCAGHFTEVVAQSYSQDLINRMMPKPIPTSPNVASLGKFGEYQVSHFSGLPQISIPIFEVKSGSLSIPISLSYHASGVKPTDVASWVGMGWSLSTGGQISRAIVGKPDEQYYSGSPLNPTPSVCTTFEYLYQAATSVTDTEPDVFNYSYGGASGRFMWTYNNPPYLIPYAPINIATSAGFGTFTITDENGIVYSYGQNASVETTTAANGQNPIVNAINAWHLTQMQAPNSDDQINLSYQNVGQFATHDISYSYTIYDQCSRGGPDPEKIPPCPTNSFFPEQRNIDSYGTQMGPNEIIFETGKIKFFLSSVNRLDVSGLGLKYLDHIEIQNLDGSVQKKIKFIYSYFTTSGSANAALKLDAVEFRDASDVLIQKYQFDYYTNSFSWIGLPLNARDLWGYYNGATGNTDLITPTVVGIDQSGVTTNVTIGGAADRAVNPAYAREGVLKRITFPTGGYTEFDYESNQYLDNGTPTLAGGIRVKKISSYDDVSSTPIIKTYKYGNGETGYGVPNFSTFQYNYMNAQFIEHWSDVYTVVRYRLRTYTSNSAFSSDPFDSSPIVYHYVTEYLGDPAGNFNGKTVFIYDNETMVNDVNYVVPSSSKYYRNSFFWKRGKLTSKIVFDKDNHKLSEIASTYSPFNNSSKLIGQGVYVNYPEFAHSFENSCTTESGDLVNTQMLLYSNFTQDTGLLLESAVTEINYENGNTGKYVTKQTTMSYEPTNLLLAQSISTRSNATEQSVSVHRYPFQLSANASSSGAAKGVYMLNSKHIAAAPIETYTYLQNSDGSNQRVVSAQVTTFRQCESNSSYVVPDQVFLWQSTSPVALSSYLPASVNAGNTGLSLDANQKPRINFISYDSYGNVQGASKTNDVLTSYKYGYNNSLPVAEVKNAQNTEFYYESFEENNAAGVVGNVNLAHTGNRYYNGSYTVNFTMPNSRSYVIEYWYLSNGNTWQHILKPYTGTSMLLNDGTAIDDVRIYPADAQMKSYSYDPVLGLRAIIEESGRTHLYEYDSFGRLARVLNDDKAVEKAYQYNYKEINSYK